MSDLFSKPETFRAQLRDVVQATPRVRLMRFERQDAVCFNFSAGQWIQCHFPMLDERGNTLRRAYSIASPPSCSPDFELAVTHVVGGPGSEYLHSMQVGDTLELRGPLGNFVRPLHAPAPALFIATGTGVAPFHSMLYDALRAGRSEPFWLLFGARTPEDILWNDELRAIESSHQWFRFEVTLSRPPLGWNGRSGYVQEHVRPLWDELMRIEGSSPDAWICGVKTMLLDVRQLMRTGLQIDRARIHAESYG